MKRTIKKAWETVKTAANELWDEVNSERFQKAAECVKGASDLADKLEAENWKEYPLVVISIYFVGCAGGVNNVDYG